VINQNKETRNRIATVKELTVTKGSFINRMKAKQNGYKMKYKCCKTQWKNNNGKGKTEDE
jgi:hypothetical protein